jgi:hypothetical protein
MVQPVSFLVGELGPDVDPFILHLFAALAEKERAMISTRTKARGVKLGGPKLAQARKVALEIIGAAADDHAANVLPNIRGSGRCARRPCIRLKRPRLADAQLREPLLAGWLFAACHVCSVVVSKPADFALLLLSQLDFS